MWYVVWLPAQRQFIACRLSTPVHHRAQLKQLIRGKPQPIHYKCHFGAAEDAIRISAAGSAQTHCERTR